MRTRLLLLALAVLAGPAAAEIRYSCDPATVSRLMMSAGHTTLRFAGTFTPSGAFDPIANGLQIEVSYAPETDPANAIFSVALPGSSFTPLPRGGFLYKDDAGTVGGITV